MIRFQRFDDIFAQVKMLFLRMSVAQSPVGDQHDPKNEPKIVTKIIMFQYVDDTFTYIERMIEALTSAKTLCCESTLTQIYDSNLCKSWSCNVSMKSAHTSKLWFEEFLTQNHKCCFRNSKRTSLHMRSKPTFPHVFRNPFTFIAWWLLSRMSLVKICVCIQYAEKSKLQSSLKSKISTVSRPRRKSSRSSSSRPSKYHFKHPKTFVQIPKGPKKLPRGFLTLQDVSRDNLAATWSVICKQELFQMSQFANQKKTWPPDLALPSSGCILPRSASFLPQSSLLSQQKMQLTSLPSWRSYGHFPRVKADTHLCPHTTYERATNSSRQTRSSLPTISTVSTSRVY